MDHPVMQADPHPLLNLIDAKARRAFANQINISESHLSLILNRKRGISMDLADAIERAVDGRLTASELLQENRRVRPRPRSKPQREAAE